jgi:hypothetical protein
VVASRYSVSIDIFIGNGDGLFTMQITYSMPSQSKPKWVTVADLNNDTNLDIVATTSILSSIALFFGYGDGTFGDMLTLYTGKNSWPASVVTADVNNDNCVDIAVVHQNSMNVGIFLGYCNVTFSSQIMYPTDSQSQLVSINVADLNNDTKRYYCFR